MVPTRNDVTCANMKTVLAKDGYLKRYVWI